MGRLNLKSFEVDEYGYSRCNQELDEKFLTRWANVYSLLRTVPTDARFDMDAWGYRNDNTACGTSACAAGHAALHPWFRKRGLKPTFNEYNQMDVYPNDFFGYEGNSPFDPSICEDVINFDGPVHLTPKKVAKVVRAYMRFHWGEERTTEAIEEATAAYNAEYVHRFTPWNQPGYEHGADE